LIFVFIKNAARKSIFPSPDPRVQKIISAFMKGLGKKR